MTTTAAPVRPVTTRERFPVGMLAAAIAVAAVVTAVVVSGLALRDTIMILADDFAVYHLSGSSVLTGVSPYDVETSGSYLFIYPPFAALVFTPLGLVSADVGFAIWTFVSVLALEAAVWLALGLLKPESHLRRAKFAILVTVVALPTAPVFFLLGFGQINTLLMLLVLVDLARRPGRFQGVAIGIAAGIKLTPLIFVVYFLLTRRIRAAVVSSVTFVATVLLGFLVVPGPSAHYWSDLVLDTERMMPPGTAPFIQSLRGVLAQLPGVLHAPWFWLVVAAAVGLGGLAISAAASRRGMEAAGILACAVTGLLVSPVSWPEHWVWVVPGIALWLWWALRRRSPANVLGATLSWLLLVASAAVMFLMQLGVLSLPLAGAVLISSLQVLAGLGFVGTLAVVLWRRDRARVTAGREW
jgi:alpha-1,2-mannosyltransferase